VIAKLQDDMFFEIIVKELIAAPIVPVNRKYQLLLATMVVVACIHQPHFLVQEGGLSTRIDDIPVIGELIVSRTVAAIFPEAQPSKTPSSLRGVRF
jgi:hypothetical protein